MKLALIAIVMGLSAPVYAQAQPVSLGVDILRGDQLRTILVGHTLHSVNMHQQPYDETFNADGTIIGRSVREDDLQTPIVDTGHWGLEGNSMCIAWDHWQGGQTKCWNALWDPAAGVYRYAQSGVPFSVR